MVEDPLVEDPLVGDDSLESNELERRLVAEWEGEAVVSGGRLDMQEGVCEGEARRERVRVAEVTRDLRSPPRLWSGLPPATTSATMCTGLSVSGVTIKHVAAIESHTSAVLADKRCLSVGTETEEVLLGTTLLSGMVSVLLQLSPPDAWLPTAS